MMASSALVHTVVDTYDADLGYHPTVLPLDVRLGLTTKSELDNTDRRNLPLKWGILATGKVAHDFCQALKFLGNDRHVVAAVGSRTIGRAEEFAKLHCIRTAHGSYEGLCQDANVDIIYVASMHPDHRRHSEMALRAGKHVLVEKPMAMQASDAEALYQLGADLDLFVGEGMWTRFFPAVEWARTYLTERDRHDMDNNNGDNCTIGSCRVIQADFSIDGDDVGPYPTDSIYQLDVGGSAAWTMAPYVVAAAMLPFGRGPDTVAANGISPDEKGVGELAAGMTLTFESSSSLANDNNNPNKRAIKSAIATGLVSYLAESSENTMYAGKGGRITLLAPAHCPTSVTLTEKCLGRGNGATNGGDDEKENDAKTSKKSRTTLSTTGAEFPLPDVSKVDSVAKSGGIVMPNSIGFVYEAEAVRRLIGAGLTAFPQWTPAESVACIQTIETVVAQIRDHQ